MLDQYVNPSWREFYRPLDDHNFEVAHATAHMAIAGHLPVQAVRDDDIWRLSTVAVQMDDELTAALCTIEDQKTEIAHLRGLIMDMEAEINASA